MFEDRTFQTRMALVLAVGVLALTAPAAAGPLEDGQAAADRGDYAAAFRLWLPLARAGDMAAQYQVGLIYADGRGVPQDRAVAAGWYRRAAAQGFAMAEDALGDMAYDGMDRHQDYGVAAQWYRMAADQGYDLSETQLGLMYDQGFGVPQDNVQAYKWFTLRISQDRARRYDPREAIRFRAKVAARMTPDQIAEAERLAAAWTPIGARVR
jgi:TPR repeat protein